MKINRRFLLFLALFGSTACFASCVTTETTTTAPDGTVTRLRVVAPAPGAAETASAVAAALAEKVIAEK